MIFNSYAKKESHFDTSKKVFTKSLTDFGSSLDLPAEKAFDSLIKTMDEGFRGFLKSAFYLSPIDTGMGKSLCIKSFLKALVINGSVHNSGILICLQTKAEIESFIKDCDLDRKLFSVLVYNDPLNNNGRGEAGRGEAPVLFTTHKMVRSRSGTSFSEAKDFLYRGKPRNLRLWDESLLPAEPISFSIDMLASIAAPLRTYEPQFVKDLDYFLNDVRWKKEGECLIVPQDLAETAGYILMNEGKGFRKLTEKQVAVLEQVAECPDMELRISYSHQTGKALAGVISELPNDLAPAIIFDASGRLKATYKLWEKYRGNLVRLLPATNDYSDVTINLWKTKAGRDALEDEEDGRLIFRQVARLIETKPNEKWLMISFKADPNLDVLNEVRSYLSEETNATVGMQYIHWGRHFAVNNHADTKNVIIIGSWFYAKSTYQSLYHAAAGKPVGENDTEALTLIRNSEFQANFLQAFMRGHGRRSVNGKAGECTAHVIVSNSPNPEPLIAEALPGCKIADWSPIPKVLTGQAKRVADYLLALKEAGVGAVTKKAVTEALSIKPKQRLTTILRSEPLQEFLEERGIRTGRMKFELSG